LIKVRGIAMIATLNAIVEQESLFGITHREKSESNTFSPSSSHGLIREAGAKFI